MSAAAKCLQVMLALFNLAFLVFGIVVLAFAVTYLTQSPTDSSAYTSGIGISLNFNMIPPAASCNTYKHKLIIILNICECSFVLCWWCEYCYWSIWLCRCFLSVKMRSDCLLNLRRHSHCRLLCCGRSNASKCWRLC